MRRNKKKERSKIGRISGGKRRRKRPHLAAVSRSAAVETPGRAIPFSSRAPAREVKKENPILCSPQTESRRKEPQYRTKNDPLRPENARRAMEKVSQAYQLSPGSSLGRRSLASCCDVSQQRQQGRQLSLTV